MEEHKHTNECYSLYGSFRDYLVHVAPSFLWADVQDVGSYQGTVYGIAYADKKIALYKDGYGSCSDCGAWGEGGEPEDELAIIKMSTFFSDPIEALNYIDKEWNSSCENPDLNKFIEAIDEIAYRFLNIEFEKRKFIKNYQFRKKES